MLEAKDAIKRLCELQDKAHGHIGDDSSADCFCGDGGFWGARGYDGSFQGGYRNDGEAIQFIEAAVAEKIEREEAEKAGGGDA